MINVKISEKLYEKSLILTKMYQISRFEYAYFYILQKNDKYRIKTKCTNKRKIIRKTAYFDKNVSNKQI